MRQTQRTRAATSTALWALARKEAATSTAPAQGAANSTAPGPHEPTDTQEWLPAQLLGHTPQMCSRTHTLERLPAQLRAHGPPAPVPTLRNLTSPTWAPGTSETYHTLPHCKQHAALPETHDMWYKHHAQKVPRNGSYGSARSPWSRRPLGDPLQRLHHRNFPRPTNLKKNWMFRSPCRCPSHPSHTSSRLLHLAAAGKVKLARADLFLVYL